MGMKSERVEVWRVDYECDSCHSGEMVLCDWDGPDIAKLYSHACDHCGAEAVLDRVYPWLDYRPVDPGGSGLARGSF